jgi:hypothetical protein
MIAFDLQCSNGHAFEGWFEDGQAYEKQKKKGQLACPFCNDTLVSKIPSTFAIKSSQVSHPPENLASNQMSMEKIGQKIVDFVEKNFDDVGCDFTKEALKIHYGVSEQRNIKGVSTKQEEKILKEEGIEFFKIPMPIPDTDS